MRILVFPAASSPNIKIRISLLPKIFDNIFPMVASTQSHNRTPAVRWNHRILSKTPFRNALLPQGQNWIVCFESQTWLNTCVLYDIPIRKLRWRSQKASGYNSLRTQLISREAIHASHSQQATAATAQSNLRRGTMTRNKEPDIYRSLSQLRGRSDQRTSQVRSLRQSKEKWSPLHLPTTTAVQQRARTSTGQRSCLGCKMQWSVLAAHVQICTLCPWRSTSLATYTRAWLSSWRPYMRYTYAYTRTRTSFPFFSFSSFFFLSFSMFCPFLLPRLLMIFVARSIAVILWFLFSVCIFSHFCLVCVFA